MTNLYSPPPNREAQRAGGFVGSPSLPAVKVETALPNDLYLDQIGVKSETLTIPRLRGELYATERGDALRYDARVSTPSESFSVERTVVDVGAGAAAPATVNASLIGAQQAEYSTAADPAVTDAAYAESVAAITQTTVETQASGEVATGTPDNSQPYIEPEQTAPPVEQAPVADPGYVQTPEQLYEEQYGVPPTGVTEPEYVGGGYSF